MILRLKPLLILLIFLGVTVTRSEERVKRGTARKLRRRIKVPDGSALSCDTQVSRPNVFPGIFDQAEGLVFDAVIELPLWVDLDKFAATVYHPEDHEGRASSVVGLERCFLYDKLEWLFTLATEFPKKVARSCLLKFICETQAIHAFHPLAPNSVLFELLHLLLSPSLGSPNACARDYRLAEDKGRYYGRCERYEIACPFSLAELLIHNFFPSSENNGVAKEALHHPKIESDWTDYRYRLSKLRKLL